jgi:hypothetical protein
VAPTGNGVPVVTTQYQELEKEAKKTGDWSKVLEYHTAHPDEFKAVEYVERPI